MDTDALKTIADLIRRRHEIDKEIGQITSRSVVAGHVGEWIAAEIFDIDLEASAVAKAMDGRFRTGPLAGCAVNIKWYGKREGLLDMTEDPNLDYYLVLTRRHAASSRGTTRPMLVDAVYLFDAQSLLETLRDRGVKIDVATSVIARLWDVAELFPQQRNFTISLSREQRDALAGFSTSTGN